MRILIIGGTGTLSLPVVQMLCAKGHTVTVLNRGNHNAHLPENATVVNADMADKAAFKKTVQSIKADVVCNFIIFTAQEALLNIECFSGRVKQFVFVSTNVVLNHEADCCITEESEVGNQFSVYGQNKAAAEAVFLQANKSEGFPVTIIRPSQTYSEDRIPLSVKGKSYWSVVSRMLRGKRVIVHGDGQSVWSSTHAEDFKKGFVGLLGRTEAVGQIYQIVNNRPHTWDMLYSALAKALGEPAAYRPVYIPSDLLRHSKYVELQDSLFGDKRFSNLFDTSKIKKVVPDFRCEIDIEKGIALYLDYMAAHPERKIEDPEFDQWCDRVIETYEKATEQVRAII